MPITDDKFGADELEQVLTKDPTLIDQILPVLTKREYFVADKTAKETYENNIKTQTKSELTSEIALKNEKMVFDLTGIKKVKADQKWYDYAGEVLKSTKDKADSLDAKIKLLEGKSDITAAERQQLKDLESLRDSKENEIQTLKTTHETELSNLRKNTKIVSQTTTVDAKMKKDIPVELLQMKKEQVLVEMVASSKESDGKIIYFAADGKTALKNQDASFMTTEQVYSLKMDAYLDKGKTALGAGGTEDIIDDTIAPGSFKTQQELDLHLSSKGLVQGTKEFSVEAKRLGREKLPLQ